MNFLYSCMVSFYSYGTCCVIIVSWRLCLGDCVLATVSWRFALATVSEQFCTSTCGSCRTDWRLALATVSEQFARVLVARTEQIGDSPLLATCRPRAIVRAAVAAVSLCMRAHASHCPTH